MRWADLHDTALMKPNQVYALALALIHMRTPIKTLQKLYRSRGTKAFDPSVVLPRLSALGAVLEQDPESVAKEYKAFARSSAEKTNVREPRQIRFKTYCRALDSSQT